MYLYTIYRHAGLRARGHGSSVSRSVFDSIISEALHTAYIFFFSRTRRHDAHDGILTKAVYSTGAALRSSRPARPHALHKHTALSSGKPPELIGFTTQAQGEDRGEVQQALDTRRPCNGQRPIPLDRRSSARSSWFGSRSEGIDRPQRRAWRRAPPARPSQPSRRRCRPAPESRCTSRGWTCSEGPPARRHSGGRRQRGESRRACLAPRQSPARSTRTQAQGSARVQLHVERRAM